MNNDDILTTWNTHTSKPKTWAFGIYKKITNDNIDLWIDVTYNPEVKELWIALDAKSPIVNPIDPDEDSDFPPDPDDAEVYTFDVSPMLVFREINNIEDAKVLFDTLVPRLNDISNLLSQVLTNGQPPASSTREEIHPEPIGGYWEGYDAGFNAAREQFEV